MKAFFWRRTPNTTATRRRQRRPGWAMTFGGNRTATTLAATRRRRAAKRGRSSSRANVIPQAPLFGTSTPEEASTLSHDGFGRPFPRSGALRARGRCDRLPPLGPSGARGVLVECTRSARQRRASAETDVAREAAAEPALPKQSQPCRSQVRPQTPTTSSLESQKPSRCRSEI